MAYRGPLHAGELSLFDICRRENLTLAVDRIHFHNRFVTPLGRPRRFDTRFFIAEAPAEQTGSHDEKETVDSIWISPRQALARNADGEFDLMKVTEMQLGWLSGLESAPACWRWQRPGRTFASIAPCCPRTCRAPARRPRPGAPFEAGRSGLVAVFRTAACPRRGRIVPAGPRDRHAAYGCHHRPGIRRA